MSKELMECLRESYKDTGFIIFAEAADALDRLQADAIVAARLLGKYLDDFEGFKARIATLEAENAELRKDAERMDWMENNATVVSMLDHMRIGFPYPDSVSKNIECIREAIDAARATSSVAE